MDESCTDKEFFVHIFTTRLENLPHVKWYKDYIVLHNVRVLLEFQSYYAKLYFFFFNEHFLCWEFMVSRIFFFFLSNEYSRFVDLIESYFLCVCVCVFTFYMHILFIGFIESQIRCKNACINLSTLTQLKIFLSLHRISYYSA